MLRSSTSVTSRVSSLAIRPPSAQSVLASAGHPPSSAFGSRPLVGISSMSSQNGSAPALDLSLPPRPAAPVSAAASSSSAKSSLTSRIGLPSGLPARPSFAASGRSPGPPRSRYDDFPPPRSPIRRDRRELDSYVPPGSRSPSPLRSDWDRRDSYRPRSPPPRRDDWDRVDTYIPRSPSPPPPIRRRSRSLGRRRSLSDESRSPSPEPEARSPSPDLPKTFFTFSHKKAEQRATREEARKAEAEARHQAAVERAEARAQRQKEREAEWMADRERQREALYGREAGPTSSKRHASSDIPSGPAKMAKSIPTGPKAGTHIPGAPTGPRSQSGLRVPVAAQSSNGMVGVPTGPRAQSSRSQLATVSPTTDRRQYSTSARRSPRRNKPAPLPVPARTAIQPSPSGPKSGSSLPASHSPSPPSSRNLGTQTREQSPVIAYDPDIATGNPWEQTQLESNGQKIGSGAAKRFMTYYCERYQFKTPEIEYFLPEKKSKGDPAWWEAVLSVGGRRIGMGSGPNKDAAESSSYLDATKYLDSCDSKLWEDFKDSHVNQAGLYAPRLLFQMSEQLNEDIYGLCSDIKQSTLYSNAPKELNQDTVHSSSNAYSPRREMTRSPSELAQRSRHLADRLERYRTDQRLESLRTSRASLPIYTKTEEVLKTIEENDVTVLLASTGSGKTTQIPQMILDSYIDAGKGSECNIQCTQPRRIAAKSVAERVAKERGEMIGRQVGYHIRFDAKLPQPDGSITYLTTGVFHKRMQASFGPNADPERVASLDKITHIIVDEVHERDLATDLLLVVLKRLLADRKARGVPLKIILMSATIDPTLFQNYFADINGSPAAVTEVPGRTFPVKRHFLNDIVPQIKDGLKSREAQWVFEDKSVSDYLLKELSDDEALFKSDSNMDSPVPIPLVALSIAHVLKKSEEGHVLVFLPGWQEIKKVADVLLNGPRLLKDMDFKDESKYSIHYLHSAIPSAEQQEVFDPPPSGVRRIILATNIAETSVTIPDVVYVVDAGRLRESRFDPVRRMSNLVLAWVSKSNLNQRAGRAGRHREGEYYGLISNMRYDALDTHQLVEMKREDLSNVVMHVKSLDIGGVQDVLNEAIEPPDPNRVRLAMEGLRMLGALTDEENLTSLGKVLLQLPIEAAVGKLLLYGSMFRCLDSALTVAAIITNRSPFQVPPEMKKEARKIHSEFSPSAFRSDILAGVTAYNEWRDIEQRDWEAACRFCEANMLRISSMLNIRQLRQQLLLSLEDVGVIAISAGGTAGRIRRRSQEVPPQLNTHNNSLPLLAGLIALASAPNFAIRTTGKQLRTSKDSNVIISPSSVNSHNREKGGPSDPSASFNPAEKRLYAFTDKQRVEHANKNPNRPSVYVTFLRDTTRLDPLTYMLFGAYKLNTTKTGLECDSWLPVIGNPYTLQDIERLKTLLDTCMLRAVEGIGKSLIKGRDDRRFNIQESIQVGHGKSSVITSSGSDSETEEDANEHEDEEEEEGGREAPAPATESESKKRVIQPLNVDELRELEMLTTDVVKILDSYAIEREGREKLYGTSSEYEDDEEDEVEA